MNFSFYMVDAAYCDYLRESDPCVPYTMERKSIRPFVGIVFSVHNVHYYAPLTSPKPKQTKKKEAETAFLPPQPPSYSTENIYPPTVGNKEMIGSKILLVYRKCLISVRLEK